MSQFLKTSPLLGACGLYCGACNHFRASFPEGNHLIEKARNEGRSTDGFTCQGCRSNRLYMHPGCAECEIRECADTKGLLHCGQCSEFPCEQIVAFINDGHIHHLNLESQIQKLNKLGPEGWLTEQIHRWTCSQCGAPFTWYEEHCNSCGSLVDSIFSDVTKD